MVKFCKFVIFCILFLLIVVSFVSATTTRYIDNIAEIRDGNVSYKINDRLGSQRVIVDEQGNVDAEYKSLPYGQVIDDGLKYGFTGKEKDVSTGLHYFSARYYDSSTGRFAGVDPVAKNHPYSYVSNNPMNYVDPSGSDPTGLIVSTKRDNTQVHSKPTSFFVEDFVVTSSSGVSVEITQEFTGLTNEFMGEMTDTVNPEDIGLEVVTEGIGIKKDFLMIIQEQKKTIGIIHLLNFLLL